MRYSDESLIFVTNFSSTTGTMVVKWIFVSNEYETRPQQSGAIFDDGDRY